MVSAKFTKITGMFLVPLTGMTVAATVFPNICPDELTVNDYGF